MGETQQRQGPSRLEWKDGGILDRSNIYTTPFYQMHPDRVYKLSPLPEQCVPDPPRACPATTIPLSPPQVPNASRDS